MSPDHFPAPRAATADLLSLPFPDPPPGVRAVRGPREPGPGPHPIGSRLLPGAGPGRVLDRLDPSMAALIGRARCVHVAAADAEGRCAAALREGPPGFVRVLDERRLAYPSGAAGDAPPPAAVGLLLLDFEPAPVGLQVNGRARDGRDEDLPGWVVVEVDEARVHAG